MAKKMSFKARAKLVRRIVNETMMLGTISPALSENILQLISFILNPSSDWEADRKILVAIRPGDVELADFLQDSDIPSSVWKFVQFYVNLRKPMSEHLAKRIEKGSTRLSYWNEQTN